MKRSTTDHKDGLHHGGNEMDDSSDSFLQGQSPDDSSGERPKTLAVTTIGKSGDSRAPQVRSVHCPDSGQAEQSRGVTVECDDAVAAVGLDNESSISSAASGMTVLEEDAEESSAPSRVAVAQLADSAKCHGDKVLQSGSLIHQPHKKGKVPAMLPTSESTIQDNQDQDFQVRPNGKKSTSVNSTNLSTLESTKNTNQDLHDGQTRKEKAVKKLGCRKSTSSSREKESNWRRETEKSPTGKKPTARPESTNARRLKPKENLSASKKTRTPMKLADIVEACTKNTSRKRNSENEIFSDHASKSLKRQPEKNIAQVDKQRTVRGVNLDIKASETFIALGKKKATKSKSSSSSPVDTHNSLKHPSRSGKFHDNKRSNNSTEKVVHRSKTSTSCKTSRKKKCTGKGTQLKCSIPVQNSEINLQKKSSSNRITEKKSSKTVICKRASRVSKIGSTKDSPIDISFDDTPVEQLPTSIFVLDNSFHIPRKGRNNKISHIESAKPTYNLYPKNVCNPIFTNDQVQFKPEILSMLPQECNICKGILCVGSKLYVYTKVDETDIANAISSGLRFLPKSYFEMYKASQGKDSEELQKIDVSQRKVVSHISDQVIEKIRSSFMKQCMDEKASSKIQSYLSKHLKMDEDSFEEKKRYYWLVNRIRMFSFMMRYNMPIQRCFMPTSAKKRKYKHTWGKFLSSAERDVLGQEKYELSTTKLLDDIFPPQHPLVDKQEKEPEKPQPTLEPVQLCSEIRGKLSPEYEKFLGKYERRTFTHIKNSTKDQIFSNLCTYVIKKRERTKYNIEDCMAFLEEYGEIPIRKPTQPIEVLPNFDKWIKKFLELLIYENPVWDLGIQYDYLKRRGEKIEGVPSISICPCSSFFEDFYDSHCVRPTFFCENSNYNKTSELMKHIIKQSSLCRHHKIVLDAIQFLYPELHSQYFSTYSEKSELRHTLTHECGANRKLALEKMKENYAKTKARYGTGKLTSSYEINIDHLTFNMDWQDDIINITDRAHYFSVKHDNKIEAIDTEYQFGMYNMFKKEDAAYKELEEEQKWRSLVNFVKKNGVRMESKKRNCTMYCVGSTVGPTNWPRYEGYPDRCGILPRPYPKCKPGMPMYDLYKQQWFQELVQTIEKVTLHYLTNEARNRSSYDSYFALHAYHRSLKIIPECLRICGTAFTNITVTTIEKEDECIKAHKDEDDIVTAMLHIGNLLRGGRTRYFDASTDTSESNVSQQVCFLHGRLTVGPFHKVMHDATCPSRVGEKYAFNFIMKKSVYDHFDKYGDIFYSQLVDRDYESTGLIATLPFGYSFKS